MAQSDEKKVALITAVGLLGLPQVVPELERLIQDSNQSTFIRTKALFAYKRLIHSTNGKYVKNLIPSYFQPKNYTNVYVFYLFINNNSDAVSKSFVKETVLPNLVAHFENESLPSAVRMTAATLIFACEHSNNQHWGRVAAKTQQANAEIKSFIATSFQSMAKMNPVSRNHRRMQQIAQSVGSQLHGVQGQEGASMNIYAAEEIEDSEVELFARFAFIKSHTANNFLQVISKGVLGLGQEPLEITPLAVSATLQSKSDSLKNADLYTQINLWNEMFIQTKWDKKSFKNLALSMFHYCFFYPQFSLS